MSNTEISKTYDIYVGKNVILTNWNGLKQHVKIVKNHKERKYLEITEMLFSPGTHFLTYTNIGEGRAVTKIELKKDYP